MKFTVYHSILFALFLFQAFSVVEPQILHNVSNVLENITEQKPPSSANQQPSASSQPPQTSSSPAPPPPPPPAQTTNPPPPASSSSQEVVSSPPAQNSSEKPTQPAHATSNSPTTPTTSENNPNPAAPTSTSTQGGNKSRTNKGSTATDSVDTAYPTVVDGMAQPTVASKSNNNNSGNKTGIIIGAVVGSIFGVALIGGLLTWINRHGGCARRSNKRSADFEDYGLADTDFPQQHLRSPAMQSVPVTASPAIGAAITPTIPRLNDQGTFYSNNGSEDIYGNNQHQQFATGYPAQMEHQPGMVDYTNNGQPMMDYNQQQPYYYQQPQDGQMAGGYYDESSYYNNQPAPAGQSYDINQQPTYQDQSSYHPANMAGDHYYKPDQVDMNHHQRM